MLRVVIVGNRNGCIHKCEIMRWVIGIGYYIILYEYVMRAYFLVVLNALKEQITVNH